MKKLHFYLEYLIDGIAIAIVIETFLKFVGISTIQLATAQKIDLIFIGVLFLDLLYRGANQRTSVFSLRILGWNSLG